MLPRLSKYKRLAVEDYAVGQFGVKVTPNTFWDSPLLTCEDGNLLSSLLKIAAVLLFCRYNIRASYDNMLTRKSLYLLYFIMVTGIAAYYALYEGIKHTQEFWEALYTARTGLNFHSDYRTDDTYLLWALVVLGFVFNFYKMFVKRHAGQIADGW